MLEQSAVVVVKVNWKFFVKEGYLRKLGRKDGSPTPNVRRRIFCLLIPSDLRDLHLFKISKIARGRNTDESA